MTQHRFSNAYLFLIQAATLSAIANAIAASCLYLRRAASLPQK